MLRDKCFQISCDFPTASTIHCDETYKVKVGIKLVAKVMAKTYYCQVYGLWQT